MKVRGIRGAITVEHNDDREIIAATEELLKLLVDKNRVKADDIAAIIFTTTSDLTAAYPAKAARNLGYRQVPLICAQEIDVEGGLPRCIRILMLVNTELGPDDITNVYLKGAAVLRQDLVNCHHGQSE